MSWYFSAEISARVRLRFSKLLMDDEETSETTFRFDYDNVVTLACWNADNYYGHELDRQWFINTITIAGAESAISAAALLFASVALFTF